MLTNQYLLGLSDEIVVDLFAGGGGMSTAIEQAIGRHVDVAVNHDADAISMHEANHPQTRHFQADIFEVDPHEATSGRPVGLLHLSPDCVHFSQASGGQPRDKRIRALSWVGKRWAGQVAPRVITLENVKQILQWGPLVAKRDKATGRVLKLDGSVAAPGEWVPVQEQYLIPDRKRAGRTWRIFVSQLRALGYDVEWRTLCAADFGAPTTRERLFLVARRDGEPIRWPEPTHFKQPAPRQKRWRAAAECIDWSIPCSSIFDRPRPLADATLRRIAKGLQRYVIESADPFIVPVTHQGSVRVHAITEPLRTITTAHRGELALAAPILAGVGGRAGQTEPRSAGNPFYTVTSKGDTALVSAYLAQMNGGFNTTPGHEMRQPMSTITNRGSQHLVAAALSSYYSDESNRCRSLEDPTATITTENRIGLIQCTLAPEVEASALRVAAFLMRYYGEGGQWGDPRDPMATITTRDRLALVTVTIQGTPYVIVDIGLRMLQPQELYLAQGFPPDYIIDCGHDGRRFSKSAQVRMCGNSVSPPPAAALIRANYTDARCGRMVA